MIITFRILAKSEQFIQAFSRIFRHIQRYLCIFSHTHRRSNRGKRGGRPCAFSKSKKCPNFGKKSADSLDLWVKLSMQHVVLRVFRRKNSNMFPCAASFSCVFDEMLIEVPKFPYPPCLTVFWIRLCLW